MKNKSDLIEYIESLDNEAVQEIIINIEYENKINEHERNYIKAIEDGDDLLAVEEYLKFKGFEYTIEKSKSKSLSKWWYNIRYRTYSNMLLKYSFCDWKTFIEKYSD